MSYLGRGSNLTRKAQDKVSFLATAGQTVRTGLSYVPTHVDVTVNGITLTEITDYTATNGNSITFTVALALNDEVTIVSSKTFDVANHYTISAANTLLAAKLTLAGGTMTGDTLHADNAKAKFGAGNDLEIYHDGNKSYISDIGTGNLILTASNLTVKDAGGTNKYLTTDASTTATTIYHNNVARLATTATGVAVTGGIALGGTGAANTLDDFETGTWNPVVTNAGVTSTNSGYYTKIGDTVHIIGVANLSNNAGSSVMGISGLPFTANRFAGGVARESGATGVIYFAHTSASQTTIQINTAANGAISWGSSRTYSFDFTYKTDS